MIVFGKTLLAYKARPKPVQPLPQGQGNSQGKEQDSMTGKDQRCVKLDMDALFEKNRPILGTYNISGAKVLHLLVQAAGHTDTTWGETHAADGLGLVFCYKREPLSFAAVYSSNMDLPQRAGPLLGCRFEATWTSDPQDAWDFIKTGLDADNPVKMAGPEDSVVYAYTDADDIADRSVRARGVGGPAMDGEVPWAKFSDWVAEWVPLGGGGMYRVAEKTQKPPLEDAVRVLASQVVEWQENHPAAGRFGTSADYGISALEQFLADLLQPEIEIPGHYIRGNTINFQHNARAALADYFRDSAEKLSGDMADLVARIAEDYQVAAESLGRYAAEGLGSKRNTESGRQAIRDTVGVALKAEKRICASMAKLSDEGSRSCAGSRAITKGRQA
jgi:hypothetical protein